MASLMDLLTNRIYAAMGEDTIDGYPNNQVDAARAVATELANRYNEGNTIKPKWPHPNGITVPVLGTNYAVEIPYNAERNLYVENHFPGHAMPITKDINDLMSAEEKMDFVNFFKGSELANIDDYSLLGNANKMREILTSPRVSLDPRAYNTEMLEPTTSWDSTKFKDETELQKAQNPKVEDNMATLSIRGKMPPIKSLTPQSAIEMIKSGEDSETAWNAFEDQNPLNAVGTFEYALKNVPGFLETGKMMTDGLSENANAGLALAKGLFSNALRDIGYGTQNRQTMFGKHYTGINNEKGKPIGYIDDRTGTYVPGLPDRSVPLQSVVGKFGDALKEYLNGPFFKVYPSHKDYENIKPETIWGETKFKDAKDYKKSYVKMAKKNKVGKRVLKKGPGK